MENPAVREEIRKIISFHVRIPNSTVFKSVLTNYTHMRVALDALNKTPGMIQEPAPYVLFEPLGDSSVILRCLAWMNQDDTEFLKVHSAAIRSVKRALERAASKCQSQFTRFAFAARLPGKRAEKNLPPRKTKQRPISRPRENWTSRSSPTFAALTNRTRSPRARTKSPALFAPASGSAARSTGSRFHRGQGKDQ